MKSLGLWNSYWGVIVPLIAFNSLQMLLLWHNYYEGIPDEILEAARVDGCGTFRIYRSILMPISLPMVATTGVLTGTSSVDQALSAIQKVNEGLDRE